MGDDADENEESGPLWCSERLAGLAGRRAVHWYDLAMVRTLDLTKWAGRWVAVDADGNVCRDAASLAELMAIIDADGIEGAEVMRSPAPGEPVVYGLG